MALELRCAPGGYYARRSVDDLSRAGLGNSVKQGLTQAGLFSMFKDESDQLVLRPFSDRIPVALIPIAAKILEERL